MTLNQALAQIRLAAGRGRKRIHYMVCGFQPLHLATFLNASLTERFPDDHVEIESGLYGDFPGNLDKAAESSALAAAVVLEWSDLDPRLGLRSSGGWSNSSKQDILNSVQRQSDRLLTGIQRLAGRMPVALAPPGLPLPPIGSTIRAQSSILELELSQQLDRLLLSAARMPGVRVIDRSHLEQLSPAPARLDAKMELLAGFPYSLAHAAALGRCLADVLYPRPPKKGLITDLDDTLWAGIVGEIGADSVAWHQEHHAQTHGLYQQMLGHLADSGVLVGVSSKNELEIVRAALGRGDLLLNAETLFPVLASWGPKSHAVAEILSAWNIGEDSVVFIDDNPMELSEVQSAFPALTCLRFPKNDPARLWSFLGELRDLFGKPVLSEEDALRRESLRSGAHIRDAAGQGTGPDFLKTLEATVTLDYRKNPADPRPLELINKTNQFNLNGLRLTEGDWRELLADPGVLQLVVSYHDKFGPLGKIAVLLARRCPESVQILHWVMSCRAFSRNIEQHTLDSLLRFTGTQHIEFDFKPTERNQPLSQFLDTLGGSRLDRAAFAPLLPHRISELTE